MLCYLNALLNQYVSEVELLECAHNLSKPTMDFYGVSLVENLNSHAYVDGCVFLFNENHFC